MQGGGLAVSGQEWRCRLFLVEIPILTLKFANSVTITIVGCMLTAVSPWSRLPAWHFLGG